MTKFRFDVISTVLQSFKNIGTVSAGGGILIVWENTLKKGNLSRTEKGICISMVMNE